MKCNPSQFSSSVLQGNALDCSSLYMIAQMGGGGAEGKGGTF